jgi:hypothetical protein
MPLNSVSDWDGTTAANNTDLAGIPLGEGATLPSQVNNLIREMMKQVKAAGFVGTASAVAFTDSLFTIKDNVDATKIAAFQASGIATGTTRTYTFPDATGTLALTSDLTSFAKLDTADQVVTGGARVTPLEIGGGTVSSGTVTPDPGDRPIQYYTNGGAHTLAPGSNKGSYILEITNNASAGAITTSGWTKVTGSFTTTNGHKFHCSCIVGQGYSSLNILALQ